jgi:hypothetical protein
MDIKKRLIIIVVVYFALIGISLIVGKGLDSQLAPAVFENPTLAVRSYLDDFLEVRISCYWDNKAVNFLILDEFENVRHNSSFNVSCNGYKKVYLQGRPQDLEYNKKYRVVARFDNQSMSSDFFSLQEPNKTSLIKKEAFSFFYFMYYQNSLARGSYSDSQRLLYVSSNDLDHGKQYIMARVAGMLFALTIVFLIDMAIWIFYFASKIYRKK